MNGPRRSPPGIEVGRVVLRHASRELKDAAQPVAVERVWHRLRRGHEDRRRGGARGYFWLWVTAPSVLAFSAGVWFGTRAERLGMLRPAPELRMSAEPAAVNRGAGPRLGAERNLVAKGRAESGRVAEGDEGRSGLFPAGAGFPGSGAPNLAEWPVEGVSRQSDARELGNRRESEARAFETRLPGETQSPAVNAALVGESRSLEARSLELREQPFAPLGSAAVGFGESGLSQTLIQEGSLALSEIQAPSAMPTPMAHEPTSESAWQRAANAGDYQAALSEIKQGGGFEQVLRHASAEQLMLLSDVARATGQAQRALAALRRIVAEFRQDPVAPLAAWSLGTLLEKTGDQAGARRAFATYRVLSPAGEFAEDSLVRELKYALLAGDAEVARQLAENYHTDFPTGRRRAEVVRLTQKTTRRSLGGADAGAPEVDEAAADDAE